MKTLIAGANLPLPATDLVLTFHHLLTAGELDLSAYLLAEGTGKVRGDGDMIFYGQRQNPNQAISLEIEEQKSIFRINTAKIEAEVGRIKICATLDRAEDFSVLQRLDFHLVSGGQTIAVAHESATNRLEKAMILAEIYRYQGNWKCRWVMQGFKNYQLQQLAESFGVEIADSAPSPQPTPHVETTITPSSANLSPPPAEITLPHATENLAPPPAEIAIPAIEATSAPQKITLDKVNRSISLEKKSHGFGLIKVNLNWNQNPAREDSMTESAVDLDLGAIVRLKSGKVDVIQALGNRFGALEQPPFIELQGDDRTGESQDGEWLFINGKYWAEIQDIFIYCYIYQGVPNWSATDGTVQIYVPEQETIAVHLTEGNNQLRLCCIARLTNNGGNIHIEREMQYFPRQRALDEHFQLGLNWRTGCKKD